jgi:hypothetical protein
MLSIMMAWPIAREFFGIAPPDASELVLSLSVGLVLLASLQGIKLCYGRRLLA